MPMRYLLFIALFFAAGTTQAQVETRLHQIFEVNDIDSLVIDIDEVVNEVNIKETYSTAIIVEMIVTLEYSSPFILEQLSQEGRYHVEGLVKDGVITISEPRNNPPIILEGREVEERIIYNIAIPEYVTY